MKLSWMWAVFLLAAASSVPSHARTETPLDALKRPGVHAIMRHALAPGTGDPPGFRVDDCASQRNLNAAGQQQAHRIGSALKDAGIHFDRVLTSAWCRCRETADLVDVGPVEALPVLNSFFRDFGSEGVQTLALKAYLQAVPAAQRVLLVTHQVNITALTGLYPRSGEVFVIEVDGAGMVQVLDRVELGAGRL